jgi:hypothetical protein
MTANEQGLLQFGYLENVKLEQKPMIAILPMFYS